MPYLFHLVVVPILLKNITTNLFVVKSLTVKKDLTSKWANVHQSILEPILNGVNPTVKELPVKFIQLVILIPKKPINTVTVVATNPSLTKFVKEELNSKKNNVNLSMSEPPLNGVKKTVKELPVKFIQLVILIPQYMTNIVIVNVHLVTLKNQKSVKVDLILQWKTVNHPILDLLTVGVNQTVKEPPEKSIQLVTLILKKLTNNVIVNAQMNNVKTKMMLLIWNLLKDTTLYILPSPIGLVKKFLFIGEIMPEKKYTTKDSITDNLMFNNLMKLILGSLENKTVENSLIST